MKNFAIVLDTETTNTIEEPICYDIGWAVVDLDTEEVVKTESYAVAEVFLDAELMSCAYFADKIPQYWDEIKNGSRKLARLSTIRFSLLNDCKAYNVVELYAHNARFDNLSLKLTQRYLTCSKYRFFVPYGVKVCDTLAMSRKAFGTDENYVRFCKDNGYLTARGQIRFTAEILYRYLKDDILFEEQHKGIDDVLIEKEILFACRRLGVTDGRLFKD